MSNDFCIYANALLYRFACMLEGVSHSCLGYTYSLSRERKKNGHVCITWWMSKVTSKSVLGDFLSILTLLIKQTGYNVFNRFKVVGTLMAHTALSHSTLQR